MNALDISIYGSYETKLNLPWSDIDIVVKIDQNDTGDIREKFKVLEETFKK